MTLSHNFWAIRISCTIDGETRPKNCWSRRGKFRPGHPKPCLLKVVLQLPQRKIIHYKCIFINEKAIFYTRKSTHKAGQDVL